MNKILILLIDCKGMVSAGTEDYNYKCQKSHEHNKRRRVKPRVMCINMLGVQHMN